MSASFPFGFEGGMWDLMVLNSDLCLSIYVAFWRVYIEKCLSILRFHAGFEDFGLKPYCIHDNL